MELTPLPPERDLARITLSVLGIGVLIAGTAWVFRPFVPALLWAVIIVVSTWPIMLRVQNRLGGRRGAAVTFMTVLLLLVLFVPLYLAISTVLEQSDRVAAILRDAPALRLPPPPAWLASLPVVGHAAAQRWAELAALDPDQLATRLAPYVAAALGWFAARAGGFGATVVQFLLAVIICGILYSKGEPAADQVRRFFRRLSGERGDAIVTLSGQAIRAVALGIVVTALVQAALVGVGLVAVRVPFAGVLAAIVFILCIAQLGPIFAMVPCVIWLYAADLPGRATVLLVITVIAQAIDNVIRPLLIKRGANLSLLLIFPGVIGGLLWLGVIGLFIGPVILAVTSTLTEGWISGEVARRVPDSTQATSAVGQRPSSSSA